jgi:hypothetical protein
MSPFHRLRAVWLSTGVKTMGGAKVYKQCIYNYIYPLTTNGQFRALPSATSRIGLFSENKILNQNQC